MALLAILAAAPAPAQAPPGAAAVRLVTLKNGARVLLAPDPHAAVVSVGVWIDTGVRFERPGAAGLSHLCEHLSARGIDPAGDGGVRRTVESLGGTATSSTSPDFSCFITTVPPASLEAVIRLEARRFAATPSQTMLDEDRATVRAEMRTRARLNPLERPLQALYATVFTRHPYRFPAAGLEEDLDRITLEDCQEHLRARYTPDHALITVEGAFDPDAALPLLRRHIEGAGRRGDSRAPAVPKEPEPTAERRRFAPGDLPVPMLAVGWRAPAGSGDAAALDLVSALLAGRSGSRLSRRLVSEESSCLFVRAARDRQRDATLFWVAAALRPGADSAAVENALVAEVERLVGEPVPGDELDRARKQLEVALMSGRLTAADRGQVLGAAQMIAGDWADADRQMERLRSLTPDDIRQAAARTLTPARRAVVWLGATPGAGAPGGSR